MSEWLSCIACATRFPLNEIRYTCTCGGLLELQRDYVPSREACDARLGARAPLDQSGVWRFREAVLAVDSAVTHPEGGTHLYQRDVLSAFAGVTDVRFKHEGENPTGSFKDRGMTVAVTQAVRLGARAVACASTGNTSAALAAYAAQAGLRGIVFLPEGKVSVGKLAQTLGYGAECLAIAGDFDDAMRLVQEACAAEKIYLVNSINPFRIEGQKTIVFELLQDLAWQAPDWIAVPAGNLGNTSAFGKALREAHAWGWIDRVPRLLAVQAHGANPFFRSFSEGFATRHRVRAETVASAIRIGDPVSYDRARAAIAFTRGLVCEVTDEALLTAKRAIDAAGIGCEPASACTLAGVKQLRESGVIAATDRVVCVLTGHMLKDTDAIVGEFAGVPNVRRPTPVKAELSAVVAALAAVSSV
jgi:threonine synthase